MQQNTVYHLGWVQFMSTEDSQCVFEVHGLVTVQPSDLTPLPTIVDIRTILGLVYLILRQPGAGLSIPNRFINI